jgi:predicted MFS family arabinose efflux permease
VVAETAAFGAWTAFLTFNGVFFVESLRVPPGAVGWPLAAAAAAYFVSSAFSGRLVVLVPRRLLVAGAALLMAVLLPLLLGVARSVPTAVLLCLLLGAAAGVRTPASGSLGLAQLSHHPGAMMAVRTGATQLGYMLGSLVGGAVIVGMGYGALGLVLAAGLIISASLVLRLEE